MGVPVGVNRLQTHLVAFVCINYAYANLVVDGVADKWGSNLGSNVEQASEVCCYKMD